MTKTGDLAFSTAPVQTKATKVGKRTARMVSNTSVAKKAFDIRTRGFRRRGV